MRELSAKDRAFEKERVKFCIIPLLIASSVFSWPKILPRIFVCIIIMSMLVVLSSEVLLKNAASTESRTEIQEVTSKSISKESITTVEYKDLEGNTKKTFISGVKTSEEYIPYSYIETKTYRIGFLYKDVNTQCLKKWKNKGEK